MKQKCVCKDCGKVFIKGEQDDNEEFCLRCDMIARIRQDELSEYDRDEETEKNQD